MLPWVLPEGWEGPLGQGWIFRTPPWIRVVGHGENCLRSSISQKQEGGGGGQVAEHPVMTPGQNAAPALSSSWRHLGHVGLQGGVVVGSQDRWFIE